MKKAMLALFVCLLSPFCSAQDDIYYYVTWNNADTGSAVVFIPTSDGANCIMALRHIPGNSMGDGGCVTVSSPLSLSAGRALSVDLSSKANVSHAHAASDITSGTFATARIPALSISQTTGLQTALDAKQGSLTLDTSGTGAATLVGNTLKIPTPSTPSVPVINRAIITTASDGTYTWTFPTACSGTAIVQVTAQNSVSGEVINHKLTAVSSTSATVATSRAVLTLNGLLGLTIPIIQTNSAQVLHLTAICP